MHQVNTRKVKKIHRELLLAVQSKLDELTSLIEPCLVSLTAPERELLYEVGEESIEFLKLSHEMALGNPELFPEFLDLSRFGERSVLTAELWTLFNKIESLRNSIIDTKTLFGNNAMENALAFYNTVKIAARRNIPGVRVVFEELKAIIPPRRKLKT